MALFGGLIDIAMTSDGDFIIANNELKQVSGIDWFIQEVNKILKSSNDWFFAPNAGMSLEEFYGVNNTREVAKLLEQRIRDKITRQNIQFPANLTVKVIPISRDEIKIYINLEYAGDSINISKLVFDLQKGSLQETEDIEKNSSKVTPIKHPYATRFM